MPGSALEQVDVRRMKFKEGMVPRIRVELMTRGFSVRSRLGQMVVLRTTQDYVVWPLEVDLFVSGHYGSSPQN